MRGGSLLKSRVRGCAPRPAELLQGGRGPVNQHSAEAPEVPLGPKLQGENRPSAAGLPGCTLLFKVPTLTLTPYLWLSSPLPTLGRSWTSWSCGNCWCSWSPGEYLPLSPGPWEQEKLPCLSAWPFGSGGGSRDENGGRRPHLHDAVEVEGLQVARSSDQERSSEVGPLYLGQSFLEAVCVSCLWAFYARAGPQGPGL